MAPGAGGLSAGLTTCNTGGVFVDAGKAVELLSVVGTVARAGGTADCCGDDVPLKSGRLHAILINKITVIRNKSFLDMSTSPLEIGLYLFGLIIRLIGP